MICVARSIRRSRQKKGVSHSIEIFSLMSMKPPKLAVGRDDSSLHLGPELTRRTP